MGGVARRGVHERNRRAITRHLLACYLLALLCPLETLNPLGATDERFPCAIVVDSPARDRLSRATDFTKKSLGRL